LCCFRISVEFFLKLCVYLSDSFCHTFGTLPPHGIAKALCLKDLYYSQNPAVSFIFVTEFAHVYKIHLDLSRQSVHESHLGFVMFPGWFVENVCVLRFQPLFDVFFC
jgi:hypothetical protein